MALEQFNLKYRKLKDGFTRVRIYDSRGIELVEVDSLQSLQNEKKSIREKLSEEFCPVPFLSSHYPRAHYKRLEKRLNGILKEMEYLKGVVRKGNGVIFKGGEDCSLPIVNNRLIKIKPEHLIGLEKDIKIILSRKEKTQEVDAYAVINIKRHRVTRGEDPGVRWADFQVAYYQRANSYTK